jgi:hypothetical protein
MPFEAQDKPALPVKAKYRGEGGQRQENQGYVCDLAIYISECPTTRQLPSLLDKEVGDHIGYTTLHIDLHLSLHTAKCKLLGRSHAYQSCH